MWILRYLIPGGVLILLGGFAFQNLDQRITVRFIYWEFYNVPLILIIATAFVAGILLRYLVVLTHWMEKKGLEKSKRKFVEAQESDISAEKSEDILTPLEEEKKKDNSKEVEGKS